MTPQEVSNLHHIAIEKGHNSVRSVPPCCECAECAVSIVITSLPQTDLFNFPLRIAPGDSSSSNRITQQWQQLGTGIFNVLYEILTDLIVLIVFLTILEPLLPL